MPAFSEMRKNFALTVPMFGQFELHICFINNNKQVLPQLNKKSLFFNHENI